MPSRIGWWLPDDLLEAVRREVGRAQAASGQPVSEQAMGALLLREALDARQRAAERRRSRDREAAGGRA